MHPPRPHKKKTRTVSTHNSILDEISNRKMLIVMGDMNSKVGSDNTGKECEIGKHGLGEISNCQLRFLKKVKKELEAHK